MKRLCAALLLALALGARAEEKKPAAAKASPAAARKAPAAKAAPEEPNRVADGVFKFGKDISLGTGQSVDGPVVALGGSVAVDGRINGPVIALGGSAQLGPHTVVSGPVVSLGGSATLQDGARVEGPVIELPHARSLARLAAPLFTAAAALAALAVVGKLVAGVGWLLLAVVLWALFPAALRNTRDTLERETTACFAWGVVCWPALAAAAVAFLVSLVGIPLVPLVAFLAAAVYVWGMLAVAFWLGDRIGGGRWESGLVSVLVGVLALKALAFVPLVRWAVWAATTIFGAGAAFASRFGTRAAPEAAAAEVK